MSDQNQSTQINTAEDQLINACFKGYGKVAHDLLLSGVSPNCQGIIKTTPLNAAVTHRHFPVIDLLLDFGADINFESSEILSFSRTPLAIACHNGDKEMAEFLLQRGAQIDLMSGIYGNPLHAAIESNNLLLLRFILEMNANVEAKIGVYLDTPICAAARSGNKEAIKLLVQFGAKTKPLRKMERHQLSPSIVRFLKSEKYL
ncbi:ankyrin repeat domain-containing protein [Euzebyella saccharophila]|uniref:Ankyrin repeat domain-containing protein n=1 Tax=Euzebyella saccharophila TaxID=679664 RepID=A0ABV8JX88_9FLAO|nr:ankyrin repeat domain-containing protein [Euzebyella saccharophila]